MEKTKAIVYEGMHKRLPVIRLNGQRVKVVPQVKYLGIVLDQKFNYSAHVLYVSNKDETLAVRLRTLAVASWDF